MMGTNNAMLYTLDANKHATAECKTCDRMQDDSTMTHPQSVKREFVDLPSEVTPPPDKKFRKAAKPPSFKTCGPYLDFTSHEPTSLLMIKKWIEDHPLPTKKIQDPDAPDGQEPTWIDVQITPHSHTNLKEKEEEAAALREWATQFVAYIDEVLLPGACSDLKALPKAVRPENLRVKPGPLDPPWLTAGFVLNTERGDGVQYAGTYLTCTCPKFMSAHTTGFLQASTCTHLMSVHGPSGIKIEEVRILKTLRTMALNGHLPWPVSKLATDGSRRLSGGRLVNGHVLHRPPEPKTSQFRWYLYVSCGCGSHKYANASMIASKELELLKPHARDPVNISLRKEGHAHPTMRFCKHTIEYMGADVVQAKHAFHVDNARRQDWVPVFDRPAGLFVGREWVCTCPAYESEFNMARIVRRCKHIDGIHNDIKGTQGSYKCVYEKEEDGGDVTVSLEKQFYKVKGSNDETYVVYWKTSSDEDSSEFLMARERLMDEVLDAKKSDVLPDDDW